MPVSEQLWLCFQPAVPSATDNLLYISFVYGNYLHIEIKYCGLFYTLFLVCIIQIDLSNADKYTSLVDVK